MNLIVTYRFSGASTTLNALYEINPARNGGLNFAFDEVVRKKEERKKMEAGACPDCIEVRDQVSHFMF